MTGRVVERTTYVAGGALSLVGAAACTVGTTV